MSGISKAFMGDIISQPIPEGNVQISSSGLTMSASIDAAGSFAHLYHDPISYNLQYRLGLKT
jgi:hypothetical protein